MSSLSLERQVWPVIRDFPRFGKGSRMQLVEGGEGVRFQLDVSAGIDAIVHRASGGTVTFASRVQWAPAEPNGAFPYNTFTIRAGLKSGGRTELAKRAAAISGGDELYPRYTVQAYCDFPPGEGGVLSVGIALTEDVIGFAVDNQDKEWFRMRRRMSGPGDAVFDVVKWHEVDAWEWHAGHETNNGPLAGFTISCPRCQQPMPWARGDKPCLRCAWNL